MALSGANGAGSHFDCAGDLVDVEVTALPLTDAAGALRRASHVLGLRASGELTGRYTCRGGRVSRW